VGALAPEDEVPGHVQLPAPSEVLPEVLPLAAGALLELEPLTLDCELWLVELDVLPLAAGCEALELDDGELELLLVDGEVEPAAAPLEVVPELGVLEPAALPEPVDWLVCAPCVIVEDGLVVVAFWLAEAEPVDTLLSPVPRFTPAPTLAPALTSVLLMPTFASTPTFGLTFTPPEGAVVEPLELLGCEDCVELEL
jgi:hypothetical protein